MSAFSWLRAGSDRELAATDYPHRESATARRDRKAAEREQRDAAKRRRDHHRNAAAADRDSQRWQTADRRRFGG